MSSSTTGTTRPTERVAGEQRLALLRAVTEGITGRGRVLGPAGTWVRLDFEDLRGQLRAG